jgi:outer membrane lipase/esterase
MQQLAGEEQASTGRLATESSNNQYANIGMRLDAIRAGSRATAGGLNVAVNGQPLMGINAGDDGTGWAWFLNGAVGTGDRDATAQEDSYEYDSYGGTLGADYQFDSGLVAGVALGYYDYQVDFDDVASVESGPLIVNTQAGGGFETDGYALSAYLVGNVGRFYIDGLVSYGSAELESERIVRYQGSASGKGGAESRVVNRSMIGETDSETLTLGFSTGTVFNLDAFDLGVDAGLSYLDVSTDAYTEQEFARGGDTAQFSGLNLAYDDQDFDSLQSRIGAQLSRTISTGGGVFLPYFSVAWRYEFKNDPITTRARLAVQQEGDVFGINAVTDEPDDSFFEIGVGVSAVFANNLQGFIEYRTVAGLDDVSANLISLGIRGVF